MTNPTVLLRTLVIYGIALPLAIFLGYLLTSHDQWGSFVAIGFILSLLVLPMFLRWYHPLLFICWNTSAVLFFLPGRPELWLFVAIGGFLVAVIQRTLNANMQMNLAPSISWPLLVIAGIVLITAKLTGGVQLGSFGGSTAGGRRYIYVVGAVLGYFALTSHRIPPNRVYFYVGAYYLGALTNLAADLVYFAGDWLTPILFFFPTQEGSWTVNESAMISRDIGLTYASAAVVFYLLARYGIKNILNTQSPARLFLLMIAFVGSIAGGYRSMLIVILLVIFFLFWMEGLLRTHYSLIAVAGMIMIFTAIIPFANKLPMSIQRSLSVLPIVEVDPLARLSAETTSEWRIQMWRDLMPEIPHYLWLGKGLSINTVEFISTISFQSRGQGGTSETFKMSADYHNGPLSVLIPFGIWGVIGMLWLWWAGLRALVLNYRNGDPAFKRVNCFLLAMFGTKIIMFLFVFGAFAVELFTFSGLLGLSISLNNGICETAPAPVTPVQGAEKFPPLIRRFAPGRMR